MSEFNVGDLVEAVKGETRIVARLLLISDCLFFEGWGAETNTAVHDGYTLSLVEAAPPPLPTVSGIYEARREPIMDGFRAWVLDAEGNWWLGSEIVGHGAVQRDLTRLASVPDTAKKVLDRVAEILRGTTLPNEFGNLAEEFGVSDV